MSEAQPARAWTAAGWQPIEGDASGGRPPGRSPIGETLAADSWLVVDGEVLALDRHRLRFADAVAEAGGDRLDALSAARQAMGLVPAGRWSPRLDLTPDGLRLRIRTPPPAGGTVDVVTARRDPRTLPSRKGPDIAALAVLQEEETAHAGIAVEPVLVSPEGWVAESAWSAVLWWRGATLCVPDASIARVASVTASVIVELARQDGIEVREERAAPADLDGCEVWLANALRGVRGVAAWHDGPAVGEPERAAAWHRRLAALRTTPTGVRR
ncbi:aminotransferase class IV [Agrococcus beijingensis]|uniref:aminotransferase class IV n=1 Tax=Agrococcus beijingensis TaxID=3068634 RepID=UPI002740928B|nr:aminotransferase class IV [Agrococcus sp. REN33]